MHLLLERGETLHYLPLLSYRKWIRLGKTFIYLWILN
jgi:hypothetical protein